MKTLNRTLSTLTLITGLNSVVQATCNYNINMDGHRIVNVGDPIHIGDVVNKKYLEEYMYETMKKRFIRNSRKSLVLDVSTNLMWQDDTTVETVRKQWLTTTNYNDCRDNGNNCYNTAGDTAATYCEAMTLGGYDDWRMPTQEELRGIVKSTASDPSISNIFHHTASSYYWSSTTHANYSANAWHVYFNLGGTQSFYYKKYHRLVRCVRAGQ